MVVSWSRDNESDPAMSEELTYGLSSEMFATRKANGESIVVGGVSDADSRWIRIVSYRAAQLLWYQMSKILNPENAQSVNASLTTAPMRDANLPTITTHVTLQESGEGDFDLTGWSGDKVWHVTMTRAEISRFWESLSLALYPDGTPL